MKRGVENPTYGTIVVEKSKGSKATIRFVPRGLTPKATRKPSPGYPGESQKCAAVCGFELHVYDRGDRRYPRRLLSVRTYGNRGQALEAAEAYRQPL